MADKLDHLNERQMASENRLHSFQSVWAAANHRPCKYDPDADPDPDPMPAPGRDNRLCLYNMDDLTVKYTLIKDVNMDELIKINIAGDPHLVKPPKHVKWKWLINWAKAAQCNRLYKQIITPYGTFMITNHCIDEIHFPTQEDARLVAKFRCNITLDGNVPPGSFVDISDMTIVTREQFCLTRGIARLNHPVWNAFGRGIPESFSQVNWNNIRDSWRYCYVFDNVLTDEEKRYGPNREMKFRDTVDLFTFAMYQQFDWWFSTLRTEVDRRIQLGIDRNQTVEANSQYSNYVNGVKLKDIPDYDDYEKWHFVKGWQYYTWGGTELIIGSKYDRRRNRH